MDKKSELILISKYQRYIEYMLDVIMKLPRVEKYSIGHECKKKMYEDMASIMYINKLPIDKRLEYINLIDANLNLQRTFLRIMYKYRWIDIKKFNTSIVYISEIGKIIGGLLKYYAKEYKK